MTNILSRNTILLRFGVAFVFLYPPIDAYFYPTSWIGYFPQFVRGYIPDPALLTIWGIVEIIIGLWILSGKRITLPSVFATLLLISIVFFNLSSMEVVFRDIAIAFVTATLAWWSYVEKT